MSFAYRNGPFVCRRLRIPPALIATLLAGVFMLGLGVLRAEGPNETPSGSPSDKPAPQAQAAPQQAQAQERFVGHRCRCGRFWGRRGCFARWRCCRRRLCRAPGSAGAENPDPYAWKDLFDGKTLTGWKVPNFGGEGEVRVEDGKIVMEVGNSLSGITYTGEVPRENYELTLEGMRLSGADFFCTTTFPVGKDPCTLVVGGWGGTVVGLSNVDFYDASDNLTTTFQEFKDKQWYRIRIRVTDAKIEAWIDDEQVVNQERKGHKFDIRIEVDLCKPLGISTWDTSGAVRNIRLRRLKPES